MKNECLCLGMKCIMTIADCPLGIIVDMEKILYEEVKKKAEKWMSFLLFFLIFVFLFFHIHKLYPGYDSK